MPYAYFCWLKRLIGSPYIEENYSCLLNKLFVTDYFYELEYDENRAADGLFLRKKYTQNGGMMLPNLPCSVLEMMIALAQKAEDDIMHDPDFGDRTGQWFWVMLQNLGLDIFDNIGYDEVRVDKILNVFMHHLYAPNGSFGGMFPCKKCCRDMRKTDIWWQLNAFFEENYPVPIW